MKFFHNLLFALALLVGAGTLTDGYIVSTSNAAQVLLNNTSTKLTAAVAAGDVTITVTPGDGAKFASATGGNTIRATLVKMSGFREIAWEIVDVTARSTDTLTITRARESTSALTLSVGDVLDVRFTAGAAFARTDQANTFTGHQTVEGVTSTGATGTGKFVFDTTPTLATPVLGVASATSINKVAITAPATSATLTLVQGSTLATSGAFSTTLTATNTTNVTLPTTGTLATLAGNEALTNKSINGNTITAGTFVLTGAASKTLTFNNTLTLAGTDSTTMTFPPASANVGYLEIPQNSQSAAYVTVLADSGKHLYHPSADTTARTFTIAANASVAYPVGTAITFVNDTSGGVITIAINSDTLVLAGAGSTGSRTLAASCVATAIKITTVRWMISGPSCLT